MTDTSLFVVEKLALPGVIKFTPKIFADDRGFLAATYVEDVFGALGITAKFVQDNSSHSHRGVIRGMHFQCAPHAQDKLVRCAHGEVIDVAADHDPVSPTYGMHVAVTLKDSEQTLLYIPGKYAHGFGVLSDEAVVEYKLTDTYHPECAGGVPYNDPVLNIPWPITDPVLSKQDKSWALLPPRS